MLRARVPPASAEVIEFYTRVSDTVMVSVFLLPLLSILYSYWEEGIKPRADEELGESDSRPLTDEERRSA